MPVETSPRPGLHPSIVLSAYVEPLVRGRRVAVLGDATIGLADELSQRGARLVHVYDPDTARTAEALARAAPGRPHQVAYAVLAGDLGVRDGAFDVVVVPDLALFADPAEIMRRVRRLCAASGVAVFVIPNQGAAGRRLLPAASGAAPVAGAGLGYYELFDLVSLQFAKVRMIGQAPFVGYTVADFTLRGEPEVSVDTSLLGHSEEPEHFIALASDRPVSLDAYAVIELPWHDVADAYTPSAGATAARAAETAALVAAELRATELGVELEKAREHAAAQARETEAKAQAAAGLSARVAELETSAAARASRVAELETSAAVRTSRVIELETEIAGRDVRLKELEARAGDSHVRAERLTNQIRDLDEELRRQRDRGTKLSKLLDDEKKGRTKAEVELGMLRGRPEAPGAKERAEALAAELSAAQQRISDLELELTQTPRRPSPLPAAPDPQLVRRVEELTAALATAQRQAVEALASAQREATEALAAKREAADAIMAQREAAEALAAAQREAAEGIAEAQRSAAEAQRSAAEAIAQRDGSIERARRAEAELSGRAPADAQVADLERDNDELAARVAASTDQVADLEKRLLAEREREMAAARIAADGVRRLAEAEKQAAEAEKRASDLARSLSTAEKRASELNTRLAAQDTRLAELGEALAAERRKAAERTDDRGDAAVADLASLETALRERGRVIIALQRDLRESERIGRELLSELTALGTNGTALPVAEDLRARLDTLAQSAARGEADLTAAAWKIAQLERELSDARSGSPAASAQVELEQALAAARDEVAALRRALESRPG